MLLIVGLGNPGAEYARHRHNVGFVALDAIRERHGFEPWRSRFHGKVSEGTLAGVKALLLKPETYMNESGRAVAAAAQFYKIEPADIVVIHDEVDLPPGKTRIKAGGGTAGHNGIRSVTGYIGNDYRRLRIGVGHPGVKEMVSNHVLRDFAKADAEWLNPLIGAIAEYAPLLAEGKDSTFANRLHEAAADSETKSEPKPLSRQSEPVDQGAAPPPKPRSQDGPLARGLRRLFGGKEKPADD
jgi:PTH1 family peptidyl-tRNA hydrolase